jgi:hypothetical protein
MMKFLGIIYAAVAALVIATAPINTVQAAPALAGSGNLVREAVPGMTTDVRWRGHRGGFRRGHYRPVRVYRPVRYHRPYYRPYRRAYVRPVYYGPRCVIRPARTVWTAYGWQWVPARRICRY